MVGTFFGAYIIGSLEAGVVATGISGYWVQLVEGLVMAASVVLNIMIEEGGIGRCSPLASATGFGLSTSAPVRYRRRCRRELTRSEGCKATCASCGAAKEVHPKGPVVARNLMDQLLPSKSVRGRRKSNAYKSSYRWVASVLLLSWSFSRPAYRLHLRSTRPGSGRSAANGATSRSETRLPPQPLLLSRPKQIVVYMQMGGTQGDASTLARTNGAKAAAEAFGIKLVEQYSGWDHQKMIDQFKESRGRQAGRHRHHGPSR